MLRLFYRRLPLFRYLSAAFIEALLEYFREWIYVLHNVRIWTISACFDCGGHCHAHAHAYAQMQQSQLITKRKQTMVVVARSDGSRARGEGRGERRDGCCHAKVKRLSVSRRQCGGWSSGCGRGDNGGINEAIAYTHHVIMHPFPLPSCFSTAIQHTRTACRPLVFCSKLMIFINDKLIT